MDADSNALLRTDSYQEPPPACDDIRNGFRQMLAGPLNFEDALAAYDFHFSRKESLDSVTVASTDAPHSDDGSSDTPASRVSVPNAHSKAITELEIVTTDDPFSDDGSSDAVASFWKPNPTAREFVPTLTMECPLVGVVMRGHERPGHLANGEMPEASEETWQQREANRKRSISIYKDSPEYQRYAKEEPLETRGEAAPRTPDPADRSVSKRRWKASVHEWREQVKRRCLAGQEPAAVGAVGAVAGSAPNASSC